MKVARLHAVGDVRVTDEPEPRAGDDETLVRVDAVGICGSDLHWFTEGAIGDARLARPLVLGHEIGGTIATGPRRGQRVAVDPSVPCWTCPPCRRGDPNLCVRIVFAGHGTTDGGLREYLAWPTRRVHPVPDSVSDEAIPVLEPLGVALHALDLAHQRVGQTVGVVGCGPIGLLTVQVAVLGGARAVIATEPLAHRREMAAGFGAVAVEPHDAVVVVADATSDEGLDVVIEVAGTDAAVDSAIDLVRPGGRVVLAGIPDDDRTTFRASVARRKGLTLSLCRRMKEMYPRAVALAGSKRVDLDGIVTDRFPLRDATQAFAAAVGRGGGKVLVRP